MVALIAWATLALSFWDRSELALGCRSERQWEGTRRFGRPELHDDIKGGGILKKRRSLMVN